MRALRDPAFECRFDRRRTVEDLLRGFAPPGWTSPASSKRPPGRRLRADLAVAPKTLGFVRDGAEAMAGWDPDDRNAGSGWFDPAWMFGAPVGFDVAIGNSPHVRADFRGERHKAARRAVLDSSAYETLLPTKRRR